MKVYAVTLMVIDFDGLEENGIIETLEHTRYPNHCMSPAVMSIDSHDIGEWQDNNLLNFTTTRDAEFKRLFGAP